MPVVVSKSFVGNLAGFVNLYIFASEPIVVFLQKRMNL